MIQTLWWLGWAWLQLLLQSTVLVQRFWLQQETIYNSSDIGWNRHNILSLSYIIVLLFFRFSIMVMVINDTVISTLNDYKSKSHFIHFENFEKSLQRFAWLIMHLMDRENQINVFPNAGNFWSFLQRLLILHGCDFIRYCHKLFLHTFPRKQRETCEDRSSCSTIQMTGGNRNLLDPQFES